MAANYRVLVVDDQSDVRHMLAAGLKTLAAEIDVIELPSAEEALLVASRLKVDLVVSDVRLPGMSGLELVVRVRKRNPELKIILVTGISDVDVRRQVADAGADAFFYKPVEMADYLDAVERCLGLVQTYFPMPPVAEAPEASALPVHKPAASHPLPSLVDKVAGLRQELDAQAVILLDDAGNVAAEAGDFHLLQSDAGFIPALMAALSSGLKVSHALGAETPENLMYFASQQVYILVGTVGMSYVLLVISAANNLVKASAALRQAGKDLQQILASMGVTVQLPVESKPPAVDLVDLEVNEHELVEAEAFLGQIVQERLDGEEVEAFWDAFAEQSDLVADNVDSLSYEQARRLGLAPDE
jgi:DNA-binding response OmpR family regulator